MELYNEEVIDLFDPSREQYTLRVSMKIKFVRAIVNSDKMVGGC
jgi:hypothetical protein